MALDFANQIINALAQYLPYTPVSLGGKYQATDVAISTGKVTLTLDSSDYDIVAAKINDATKPNLTFSTSGFYLKNTVTQFVGYPEDSTSFYAFEVKFSKPHKLKQGEVKNLKGFSDTQYNTEYKVLKTTGTHSAVIYTDDSIAVETLTTGLGYIPCQYTEGLNKTAVLADEGSDQISFTFDSNESFVTNDTTNLYLDFMPYLHDYSDFLKQMNFTTFLRNLAEPQNQEYLILDSKSLKRTPSRSKNNKSDSSYSGYTRSGSFDSNYSIEMKYVLERNVNDAENQTDSGSDVVQKQTEMGDALTSILRTPLDSDDTKIISALTISNEEASDTISEGRVVINYTLDFIVTSLQSAVMDIEDKNSYPINSVRYGTNVVDFS